jgi:hypothetical protein
MNKRDILDAWYDIETLTDFLSLSDKLRTIPHLFLHDDCTLTKSCAYQAISDHRLFIFDSEKEKERYLNNTDYDIE